MLGALDGQLVPRIVMNHLRNAAEGLRELTQDELTALVDNLHVHEPTRTPVIRQVDVIVYINRPLVSQQLNR